MDFNKAGIPKFGIGDPLGENFVAWSRGMHFPRDSRYGAFAGNVEVEDGQQRYKVRADQNYTVGEAAFVEIQEVYAGDSFEGIELLTTTPEFFAEQLAKIGSIDSTIQCGVYLDSSGQYCWCHRECVGKQLSRSSCHAATSYDADVIFSGRG